MMTLGEFLLARIADDEAVARETRPDEYLPTREDSSLRRVDAGPYASVGATSGRVLAECEAKRRIVELHGGEHVCWLPDYPVNGDFAETNCWGDCATVLYIAAIYADHPDYREEWRS